MTKPAISTIFASESADETFSAAASDFGVAGGICAVDAMPVGFVGALRLGATAGTVAGCCGARALFDSELVVPAAVGGFGTPVESPHPTATETNATKKQVDFI